MKTDLSFVQALRRYAALVAANKFKTPGVQKWICFLITHHCFVLSFLLIYQIIY